MHALLLASLFAADPEPATPPKGPPPQLAVLKDAGMGLYLRTVTQMIPVTKKVVREVEKDGKKFKELADVVEYQAITRSMMMRLGKATATTVGGKKLDAGALAKALEKPQTVLMSADGKPVDKAWLKAFKPETLVLVPESSRIGIGRPDLPPPLPPVIIDR